MIHISLSDCLNDPIVDTIIINKFSSKTSQDKYLGLPLKFGAPFVLVSHNFCYGSIISKQLLQCYVAVVNHRQELVLVFCPALTFGVFFSRGLLMEALVNIFSIYLHIIIPNYLFTYNNT